MAVIYKIKRFTRAEKEAWRELYRFIRTGGKNGNVSYTRLPNTGNPRDLFRAQKLAIDLGKLSGGGNKKEFDIQNAKTLLQNAGLNKSASQVEKILNKYTNKRALVRLKRLKDREGIIPFGHKGSINRLTSRLVSENKDIMLLDDKYKERFPRKSERMNKLIRFAHKQGIPVTYDYNTEDGSFIKNSWSGDKDARKIIKYNGGRIYLDRNANERTLAHEIGHYMSNMRSPYSNELSSLTFFNPESPINSTTGQYNLSIEKYTLKRRNDVFRKAASRFNKVINEKSANIYGNSVMRKAGIDPNAVKSNVGNFITDASYASSGLYDIAEKANK